MKSESGFFTTPDTQMTDEGFSGVELLNSSVDGFCRVFMARHHGRKVILKGIKPEYVTDPLAQAQLQKEYALGFSVDSDYVCRTLGRHTLSDGCPAIEMEYCAGVTLREALRFRCNYGVRQGRGCLPKVLSKDLPPYIPKASFTVTSSRQT